MYITDDRYIHSEPDPIQPSRSLLCFKIYIYDTCRLPSAHHNLADGLVTILPFSMAYRSNLTVPQDLSR